MATTDRNVIELFASTGNHAPVSVADLQDMKDWVTENQDLPNPATASDLVDAWYKMLDEQIAAKKRSDFIPTRIGNQP